MTNFAERGGEGMKRFVLDGKYWKAGDSTYIETKNDENGIVEVDLREFFKDHIEENTEVTVVICVKEKKQ